MQYHQGLKSNESHMNQVVKPRGSTATQLFRAPHVRVDSYSTRHAFSGNPQGTPLRRPSQLIHFRISINEVERWGRGEEIASRLIHTYYKKNINAVWLSCWIDRTRLFLVKVVHWRINEVVIEGVVEPVWHKRIFHNLHAILVVITWLAWIHVLLHLCHSLLQDGRLPQCRWNGTCSSQVHAQVNYMCSFFANVGFTNQLWGVFEPGFCLVTRERRVNIFSGMLK